MLGQSYHNFIGTFQIFITNSDFKYMQNKNKTCQANTIADAFCSYFAWTLYTMGLLRISSKMCLLGCDTMSADRSLLILYFRGIWCFIILPKCQTSFYQFRYCDIWEGTILQSPPWELKVSRQGFLYQWRSHMNFSLPNISRPMCI
jgi:hypothetical protein